MDSTTKTKVKSEIFNHSLNPTPVRDIFLDVLIGNKQLGASIIKFNGAIIAQGSSLENILLGKSDTLSGKSLEIESALVAINPHTNNLVITYKFDSSKYLQSDSVSKNLEAMKFIATINIS